MWNEAAWQRHLELAHQSKSYGSEGGCDWEHFCMGDGRAIFLNRETLKEVEMVLTPEQERELCFGSKLLRNMSFTAPLWES